MRAGAAVALVDQIDADLSEIRARAEGVAPHQGGEILGRGLAEEGLIIRDMPVSAEHLGDRFRDAGRSFERSAGRRVDFDQERVDVIVGEHLQADAEERKRPIDAGGPHELPYRLEHDREEQQDDGSHEEPPRAGVLQQRLEQLEIARVQPVARRSAAFLDCCRLGLGHHPQRLTPQPAVGDIGHDCIRDEQRGQHGDRRVERDRLHERPHHAGDESHGDEG